MELIDRIAAAAIDDPFNGIVIVAHDGKSVRIQFKWRVISQAQKLYGKAEYLRVVATALSQRDVDRLEEIVSIASGYIAGANKQADGAMSQDEVAEWSPPLVTVVDKLETAWLLALYGPLMKPEVAEAAEDPKKKRPSRIDAMQFMSRLMQRFARASSGKASGT